LKIYLFHAVEATFSVNVLGSTRGLQFWYCCKWLPQNIQFLCYNCTVFNPETSSFRPIQIVSGHCLWWTGADGTTVIIRNHFQCIACVVPRNYELHIIKIEYPEKGITSMKVFSKYIHFFGSVKYVLWWEGSFIP